MGDVSHAGAGGFTPDGLPVGLQIMAPTFEEATCLRIAYACEQATEWHRQWPAL